MMNRKIAALLCVLALVMSMSACGSEKEEESTSTVSGMVLSVEGTVITLVETGSADANRNMGGRFHTDGEMPTWPEGEMPTRPEGEMPTWPEGEMPTWPEGEMPTWPEGEMPTRPEGGRDAFADIETVELDLKDAHISLEIDEGKATGSMEDITVGVFVTVTLNGSGKATQVLVSQRTGFGGRGGTGGWDGTGGFGGRGGWDGTGGFNGNQGDFRQMPDAAQTE